MKLSCKTEYGIRALVHLAEHADGQPYRLQEIARHEGLSFSFLEKIFRDFKKAGIVTAQRGARGGYTLAKPLNEISMREIMEALEGSIQPFHALVAQSRAPKLHCKSHLVLSVAQHTIVDSLSAITLDDLVTA